MAHAKVYRAKRCAGESYKEALPANDALDTAIKTGDEPQVLPVEIMRLTRRGGRSSAKKAYKDLLKDNPNHAEALYLANTILSDREAGKHLSKSLQEAMGDEVTHAVTTVSLHGPKGSGDRVIP